MSNDKKIVLKDKDIIKELQFTSCEKEDSNDCYGLIRFKIDDSYKYIEIDKRFVSIIDTIVRMNEVDNKVDDDIKDIYI